MYDRASQVAAARRTVHAVMAVNAVYEHPTRLGAVGLSVRFHNRQVLAGDLVDSGYSQVVEGVNRCLFNIEELNRKGVELVVGGRITLTDPVNRGILLILDLEEPDNGPINRVWGVAKL